MTVQKTPQGFRIYETVNGELLEQQYIGYTKRDAVRKFRRECKALQHGKRCRWFLRCTNTATGSTHHPVLGSVPTCDRCHKFATGQTRQ